MHNKKIFYLALGAMLLGHCPPAEAQQYSRVGAHTWTWLERGPGSGTINWFGDDGGAGLLQTGIWGWIEG